MTLLLWLVGYLGVGFVCAVVAYRYTPSPTGTGQDPTVAAFFALTLWPIVVPLCVAAVIIGFLFSAIRSCARRLP